MNTPLIKPQEYLRKIQSKYDVHNWATTKVTDALKSVPPGIIETVKNPGYSHTGFSLDQTEIFLLSRLIDGLELHALFHEYSHFSLGHLKNSIETESNLFGFRLHILNFQQKNEKAADLNAINLLFNCGLIPEHLQSTYRPLYSSACIVLFGILNLVESRLNMSSKTHPPAEVRQQYSIKYLQKKCSVTQDDLKLGLALNRSFKYLL